MSRPQQNPPLVQRNALAPGLLAAIALFVSPALIEGEWFIYVQFVVSIFALIVAWFAFQAKTWWVIPVMVAIAALWNPIYPFAFAGIWWQVAQVVAALAFITAGALIKQPREG